MKPETNAGRRPVSPAARVHTGTTLAHVEVSALSMATASWNKLYDRYYRYASHLGNGKGAAIPCSFASCRIYPVTGNAPTMKCNGRRSTSRGLWSRARPLAAPSVHSPLANFPIARSQATHLFFMSALVFPLAAMIRNERLPPTGRPEEKEKPKMRIYTSAGRRITSFSVCSRRFIRIRSRPHHLCTIFIARRRVAVTVFHQSPLYSAPSPNSQILPVGSSRPGITWLDKRPTTLRSPRVRAQVVCRTIVFRRNLMFLTCRLLVTATASQRRVGHALHHCRRIGRHVLHGPRTQRIDTCTLDRLH
jgi:hypothetical protein